MAAQIFYIIKSPLSLSCFIHLAAFVVLALIGSIYGIKAEEIPVETVIELEAPVVEDMPAEKGIWQAIDSGLFGGSLADTITETITGRDSTDQNGDKSGGEAAVLSSSEAVSGGDGVVAAGRGNSNAARGGTASGGTGQGTGNAATTFAEPSDSISGAGSGAPAGESDDSIADRFAAIVEQNKNYPHMAMKRNQQGIVEVYATIGIDGSLLDTGIVSSSGVASLDNAAIKAVQKSCPFSHQAGHTINITIPIYFTLT